MKKKQLILSLVVLVALAALVIWGRDKIHFDFALFRAQLAQADWRRIALGIGCIYLGYVFRSVRWVFLLRHSKKMHPLSLLGTQVIGFTAVALIGRVADPVRSYLVSKKTGLPLASQVAAYIVERLFDMGTMALIFSVAMLWVPTAEIIRVTSHSRTLSGLDAGHPLLAAFIARYSGLLLTLVGASFLLVVRLSGEIVAGFFEHSFGFISEKLGHSIGEKIRSFRAGLGALQSIGDLARIAFLSLGMWLLIAFAYYVSCKAFAASAELASLTPQKCVLLMIASGGASIIQLPVLGWFTQIIAVAAVLSAGFGVGKEAATACATTLLLVTFLCIVPIGLIWAQIDHVSLRKVTVESEHAEEDLEAAEVTE